MIKFVFLFLTVLYPILSQWQADVRLTNDPGISSVSFNNAHCIASDGNNVYVVWEDNRDWEFEIYIKMSSNGGLTWGDDIRLTNCQQNSMNPSISVSGPQVHVVWQDYRDSNFEIYYKFSSDCGLNWSKDVRLSNYAGASEYPSVSITGSFIHVVWLDQRYMNETIFYRHSTDGGKSWGAEIDLPEETFCATIPTVASQGSIVHVLWSDVGVLYKRSIDGGFNWERDTAICTGSDFPSISISGNMVHVVSQGNISRADIYYSRSVNEGISWQKSRQLTFDTCSSMRPIVSSWGPIVHAVWRDNRDGNYEIYYSRSTNEGTNWCNEIRLTNDPSYSSLPCVCSRGSAVHVVWQDERDTNGEVYFKLNPTGGLVGINPINNSNPGDFSLSQNYPNPFNPTTKIRFDIPVRNGRDRSVNVIVYDILGKEVTTLVNEQLSPSTYEVEFDGTNFASGVYYYTLSAGDYFQTKKMVLIK